ncbi:21565_t:CDS:10 [Rhizophagus irregularis]|nr:21565_t:CDS:10 [Rhizophagus irregularis]
MRPSTFQHDEKKKFQIKISQDGEFAMTFDAEPQDNHENNRNGSNESNQYRWSFDISSLQICDAKASSYIEYNVNNNVVINADGMDDSNSSRRKTIIYCFKLNKNYSLDNDYIPTCCSCNYVSGIPKFINNEKIDHSEISNDQDRILKRFILLNFNGIYNFEYNHQDRSFDLNERFDYPKSFEDELNNWHTNKLTDCMNRLLSCLTNKNFLVEKYKDKVQVIEVYDLAEMKLETAAKIVKNKDRRMKKYDNKNDFTISKNKLQLCYTRGFHSIKLYLVENGLQIAAKNFEDKIEKINLLEFINNDETLLIIGNDKEKNPKAITWDLFNTGKVDSISLKDLGICCLARTSGNVLHVDNKGKVRSILNIIEKRKPRKDIGTEGKIRTITEDKLEEYDEHFEQSIVDGKVPWVKNSCKPYPFCLYDNEEGTHFKEPIVCGKEPWVMDSYKTYSFCLYDNEGETIELIVGRSTVQIWHQIRPNSGFNEDDCPNKGNPFLEYIWTNGVPLDQEYDTQFDTRLHIKKIDYGCKYFNLEVYWEEKGLTKPKSRTIQWNDIVEKVNAVRSACKALEHLNKRKRYLSNFPQKHCYEEMVNYINHIIWRFIDHDPDQYRLLDVRHNVMKNLILGDCDHLIKYILFGNDEDNCPVCDQCCNRGKMKQKEKFVIKHVPRSIIWKKDQCFVNDDDLDPFDRDNNSKSRKTVPTNDLELAIYHCKGRELKDTMIVAYLLEYYTSHAIEYAGWMTTVSKALPFLYKYNYDDYVRKLFRKECFADQDHFSAQDPYEIIPRGFTSGHFREKNFMAFRPKDRLQSDKDNAFTLKTNKFIRTMKKLLKFFENDRVRKILEFFSNDHEKPPIALRVVPLPGFTIMISGKLCCIFSGLHSFPGGTKLYEDNDDMYDNPATEAVIDFPLYLLVTEIIQFFHHGYKEYLGTIFNYFDLFSIILPAIVMYYMLAHFKFSDGFGSIGEVDRGLIVGISMSIFIMWIEFVNFIPSLNFMFILLKNREIIEFKASTFSGNVTNNVTHENINIKIKSEFDDKDNPFSEFLTSIEAAYFWTAGNWVQRDMFDFWAVDLFSIIASILFVTILQNMFIALMSGVYERAANKGRQALLRFRARQIADYEALHHIHIWPREPDPKYIYYIGKSKNFEEWSNKREQCVIYKDFEEKSTYIKHNFQETDYDGNSIWKYNKSNTKKML